MIGMPKRHCLPLRTEVSTDALNVRDAIDIEGGGNMGGVWWAEGTIVTSQIGTCCEPCLCDKTRGV
jgi:hypothetical protein